ncbi:phosphate ABC transporter substrate-binding protein (PhoT family) [Chthoniobacter flavus]|uniref:phosphate ABC transporter substrate-binding protein n=1 Tax=Chthoniobacter flavus TaxID=191863 RepID=UPI0010434972|nr:phosphate ABC transporter substrate-binding protein [Chthoniobacter flavus]TCO88530.1 phosphate ABC transporter substrate-binding protein (PhoT family) [Chthoniobacter flavus]
MMKLKTLLSIPVALAMATPVFAGSIVIKGSDTLGAKFVPQLAEAFKAKHPDTTFNIAAEGSATGIAAIIDGTAQIGMSSRKVELPEEAAAATKGVKFFPTVVAHDGIAVVVNEKNPVTKLTKKQVEQIFTGDVTDWSAVGGKGGAVSIYTRNTSSGTFKDFKNMAMKKRDYAPSSQKMAGNEQIVAEVGKNENGIGYVGLAYTKAPGVKVIVIDGTELTDANVRSGKYPYSRETYLYTNGAPAGETKSFVDFAVSEEGQKIAEQVGFVPVTKK